MARVVPKNQSGLVLTADGHWHHHQERATHPGVTRLFHRLIHKDESGDFYLRNTIGSVAQGTDLEEHVYFEVEDTPYFVVGLDGQQSEVGLELELNTGQRVPLDLDSLTQDTEGYAYCRVLDDDEARFGRHAMTQLEPFLEAEGETIVLRAGGRRVPFRARR